jgi:hypothetical protein
MIHYITLMPYPVCNIFNICCPLQSHHRVQRNFTTVHPVEGPAECERLHVLEHANINYHYITFRFYIKNIENEQNTHTLPLHTVSHHHLTDLSLH